MKEYIQNLKSKPEAERKQFAYMATVACMVVVGGVWLYGLVGHFSQKSVEPQAKETIKPFSVLVDSVKGTYNNISASVNQAKSISSIIESNTQTEVPQEKVIDLIPVEKSIQ